jgi:hypothetical protein
MTAAGYDIWAQVLRPYLKWYFGATGKSVAVIFDELFGTG